MAMLDLWNCTSMFYFGRQVKDTLCSRKHTRSVEGQVSHIDDVYLILYNMYIIHRNGLATLSTRNLVVGLNKRSAIPSGHEHNPIGSLSFPNKAVKRHGPQTKFLNRSESANNFNYFNISIQNSPSLPLAQSILHGDLALRFEPRFLWMFQSLLLRLAQGRTCCAC